LKAKNLLNKFLHSCNLLLLLFQIFCFSLFPVCVLFSISCLDHFLILFSLPLRQPNFHLLFFMNLCLAHFNLFQTTITTSHKFNSHSEITSNQSFVYQNSYSHEKEYSNKTKKCASVNNTKLNKHETTEFGNCLTLRFKTQKWTPTNTWKT
jgi:hypothetical protein